MSTFTLKRKLYRREESVKWDILGSTKIIVEYSSRYSKQMSNSSMSVNKSIVKKLIKDIKEGYLYDDGINGGDTHYLPDFSRPRIYLTYSKDVTLTDRLNYRIYKPVKYSEDLYVCKVVIDNISGHNISGKSYSED
jgi:hypothetical protein